MEIVTLEQNLALGVQCMLRSKLEYMMVFKAAAGSINISGGCVGGSIAAAKLVAKE